MLAGRNAAMARHAWSKHHPIAWQEADRVSRNRELKVHTYTSHTCTSHQRSTVSVELWGRSFQAVGCLCSQLDRIFIF